jgi:DNA adenine methylase
MQPDSDIWGSKLEVPDAPPPFLRWAGSKRWLVRLITKYLPVDYHDYYEPFLGSGAVFFAIGQGHKSYLSDTIAPLINTYHGVQKAPNRIHDIASSWPTDSETYYQIRAKNYKSPEYAAARFIYLNRLCYNGLYRENRSGGFNVPYGRPRISNVISSITHLQACSDRLKNAVLTIVDFEPSTRRCQPGDLVYFDPPYVAGHRSNGFVDYNSSIFSWQDQQRLADKFYELDRRGVYTILTNADHESVRRLYQNFTIVEVDRYSNMSSRTGTRGRSSEIIVLGKSITTDNR